MTTYKSATNKKVNTSNEQHYAHTFKSLIYRLESIRPSYTVVV